MEDEIKFNVIQMKQKYTYIDLFDIQNRILKNIVRISFPVLNCETMLYQMLCRWSNLYR